MAVFDKYPHSIQYQESKGGYEDEKGNYHKGETIWGEPIKCKAVPSSGKADEVPFADGIATTLSFVVFMEKQDHVFKYGDTVKLHMNDEVCFELKVKGFIPYTLKDKLWLA